MAKKQVEEPKAKMSKTEAVRRAVDEGITKPQEGVEWIVANFGEELRMPPGQFSSYKSQMKIKAGGGGGSPRRAAAAPTAGGVEAARQVNKLIKTYDLETVQSVAAVLYQHDSKTFRQALDFIEELHNQ